MYQYSTRPRRHAEPKPGVSAIRQRQFRIVLALPWNLAKLIDEASGPRQAALPRLSQDCERQNLKKQQP